MHPAIVSRIKVMAKMDIAEHRMPQDGRCQVVAEGKEVDLRISTLPTVLGEKVVMRVLDKQRLTFNLDELGMPPERARPWSRSCLRKPYGLMLVTGPTGSGKTTTLYSALELIKSRPPQHRDGRRPGRIPARADQPGAGRKRPRRGLRRRRCGRSCGRTPT